MALIKGLVSKKNLLRCVIFIVVMSIALQLFYSKDSYLTMTFKSYDNNASRPIASRKYALEIVGIGHSSISNKNDINRNDTDTFINYVPVKSNGLMPHTNNKVPVNRNDLMSHANKQIPVKNNDLMSHANNQVPLQSNFVVPHYNANRNIQPAEWAKGMRPPTEEKTKITNDKKNVPKTPQNTCNFPDMDPFHSDVMKTFIKNPTVNCTGGVPSLVYVDQQFLRVNITKARLLNVNFDQCRYTPLKMKEGSDHYTEDPDWSPPFKKYMQLPEKYEHLLIECTHRKKIVSQTFIALVKMRKATEEKCRSKYERHLEKFSPKETMSVLLVGIDGISKQNFIRSMPKTKDFITTQLGAMELNKLNKVGDNTLPNLAAFLAGNTMNELRENFSMAEEYFDKIDHKFIWKAFSDAGYRTGFVIDRAVISAFHYQKKGWNKPIFDYHHRPAVSKWDRTRLARRGSDFCVGQVPEVPQLFDYWLQLATVFNNSKTQPYFGYSFFCHLTHDDPNLATAGDELYLDFFKNLKTRNVLNNTIVIFFSDHGGRFGPLRYTYPGLLESRNPMMFFIFPAWFKKKYPHIMNTFRTNQNRLTTFFDVHATLKDILYFNGKTGKGSLKNKGISLFKEIPSNRTCGQAGVSMNYCLCSRRSNIEAPHKLWKVMGDTTITYITNQFIAQVRDKCHPLKLASIRTVVALKDTHNRKGREFYRAVIETTPGGAIYEALIEYKLESQKARVAALPTRLNLYRGMAECIESEQLRPFCSCKDLVSQVTSIDIA